jgi:hypothetical protein
MVMFEWWAKAEANLVVKGFHDRGAQLVGQATGDISPARRVARELEEKEGPGDLAAAHLLSPLERLPHPPLCFPPPAL